METRPRQCEDFAQMPSTVSTTPRDSVAVMRAVAIAIALAALATQAHAEATPEFIREYQAGVDAYRLGKFAEAKAHLEKARSIDPKLPGPHRFLAAVAQGEQRFADCVTDARTAIELNPQSKEIAETRKLHDDCRASAGRPAFRGDLVENGAIAVSTTPEGASVTINHLMYGGTPLLPRTIPIGKLDIEIAKAGYKSVHLTDVSALPGIVTDIIIELEVDPGTATKPPPIDPNPGKVAQGYVVIPTGAEATIDATKVEPGKIARDPGTYTVELRAPGKDLWRRRVRITANQATPLVPSYIDTEARAGTERLGLGVAGAGVAIVVVGFAATILAHQEAATAREYDRVERTRDPSIPLADTIKVEPLHTQADIDGANNRAHRDWLIGDLAFGVGAATIVAGAYLLYRGAPERTDVPPRFAIIPSATGAMISKSVTW